MDQTLTGLPPGVTLGAFSASVYRTLQAHTAFPWPVLAAQCKRLALDPAALDAAALRKLAPQLAAGVGRFTSPEKQQAVLRALEQLAGGRLT